MPNHSAPAQTPYLSFPFSEPPALGRLLEVRPNIFWLRMPLPFALNHINLWALRDGNEWTLIDCGLATEDTRKHWQTLFAGDLQLAQGAAASQGAGALNRIRRVIATHCHPDHIGLSGWLCEQFGAPFYMSLGEYAMGRVLSAGLSGTTAEDSVAHFRRHGLVDPEDLQKIVERGSYFPRFVPSMPSQYGRLREGDTLLIAGAEWRVMIGYGHSPEHVALYSAAHNLLIAGDMLLPTISTNISVFAMEPEANPLPLFLASLQRFLELPDDVLVLPAHGMPFIGAHARVRALCAHHADRLTQVRAWCTTPQSAASIVPRMFRAGLDIHQTVFALGEALAHLHALWMDGVLERVGDAVQGYQFKLHSRT